MSRLVCLVPHHNRLGSHLAACESWHIYGGLQSFIQCAPQASGKRCARLTGPNSPSCLPDAESMSRRLWKLGVEEKEERERTLGVEAARYSEEEQAEWRARFEKLGALLPDDVDTWFLVPPSSPSPNTE